MINNIITEFRKNDFEIFNRDNYYIEIFGKYLEEIIKKLNSYINEGKENEYIRDNKIKFGCFYNHFYLCCKFNEQFKEDYYKKFNMNENKLKDNKEPIQILKIKNKEKSKPKETKIKEKEDSSKEYSSEKISKNNYKNIISNNFENEIKNFLYKEKCSSESLQNLLFFFNLKILTIKDNKIET